MNSIRQLDALSSLLEKEELVRMLRWLLLARELDEAELRLLRQQKVCFSISGAGHEAVQAAAGLLLRPGHDWFFPYYRDRALCLALGVSPQAMLLQAMGRASDPSSGGRQMPSHWGDSRLNIVSQSSPTGTQFLQAVGAAEVGPIARRLPPGDDRPTCHPDELVYVSGGDGCVSEGEFFEAVSTAALKRLPVLFLIQDNEYAISVPVEAQTPGGSISWLLRGVPGLRVVETDGLDPVQSYWDLSRAIDHIRAGQGPVLVHAHVVRLMPHSNSDDDGEYRTAQELEEARSRDPIPTYENRLVSDQVITEEELELLRVEVRDEVRCAIEEAEREPEPEPSMVMDHLYAPSREPLEIAELGTYPDGRLLVEQLAPEGSARPPHPEGWTLVEAIRRTLDSEMARDSRIVVFGEDVADSSRPEGLEEVRGKGGVFKATQGLQREHGDSRVFNSPLAEAAIVGRAVGMAVRGLRPIVEIQFFDYIWPAMMQIRNELGLMRWRSNGDFAAPVVIRVPIGGYLRGGAVYHSQTGEAIFCHCPGLRVVMPSNASDAVGVLRTAIRSGDPVLFLEHKHLYRQPYTRRPDPGPGFTIPFGKASFTRRGHDVTVVTYGALVRKALVAANRLSAAGIEVEVIDLVSLKPYDFETIAESVRRTSRLVIAAEEPADFGVAAELSSRVSEELFLDLDAPVRRLGALDIPVPYNPLLEQATLPQVEDLERLVRETAEF